MTRPAWIQLLHWVGVVTTVAFIAVFLGGTSVWIFERDTSASNLKHWGDCLWWAVTTLSTVGYGEHFPVTLPGRLVAVAIMLIGVAIIGAIAAVVAFAFASRVTTRIEAAVHQMESQVEQVEAEVESFNARVGERRPSLRGGSGLRELVIGVADGETAGSLTWLLARLGWHPEAGDHGVAWRDGVVVLRVAIRPWDQPFGVQGRLTFDAGSPERLARIAREADRHGFHRLVPRASGQAPGLPGGPDLAPPPVTRAGVPPAPRSPTERASTAVSPAGRSSATPPNRTGRRPAARIGGRAPQRAQELDATDPLADGQPVTLRTVSGFEVVLVTS